MPADLLDAPAPAVDPDAQSVYNELNSRGVFQSDPEAQAIGHELRARGVVADPTQGGLVKPTPAPIKDPVKDPVDPYGDPALQLVSPPVSPAAPMPAAAPPSGLNAFQQMLGLGGTHGTIYNNAEQLLQTAKGIPAALGTLGQNVMAGTSGVFSSSDPDSEERKDTEAKSDAIGAAILPPTLGPQGMVGQGVQALQSGTFGKFAAGVPAGIADNTVQHPLDQALNVVAIVSLGEMSLSAGGRSLMANAAKLDAAAGTAGTAEEAAQLTQMAARSRGMAQALNRAAFVVHRGATGGPVGDFVREATASAAEKYFPGSSVAQTLRGKVEFQQAGLRNLRTQAGAKAAMKQAQAATDTEQAARAAAATNVTPGAQPAPLQLAAPGSEPPPDPNAGQPAPGQPPSPLAPEPTPPAASPGPQPTPTTEPMPSPSPEPATAPAPVVPGTAPKSSLIEAIDANTSPGGFVSSYQQDLSDTYNRIQRTSTLPEATAFDAQKAESIALKSASRQIDPATGLLNRSSLLNTLQDALDHGQQTQEPAVYVHATPGQVAGPETTSQMADFLATQAKSAGGHVSWYSPDAKSVGGVYVGPNPAGFTAAIAAAAAAADKHQQETGQGTAAPAMSFGTAALQPGMKPADAIKIAAAAAGGSSGQSAAAGQQSAAPGTGSVSAGSGPGLAQQPGNVSGAVLGGQSSGAAQGAVPHGGRSEAGSLNAGGRAAAPAAEHSAAGSSPAEGTSVAGPALNAELGRSGPASAGNVAAGKSNADQATLGPYSSFEHSGEMYRNLQYDPHDPSRPIHASYGLSQEGKIHESHRVSFPEACFVTCFAS